jgi:hypothetical protein
MFSSARFQFPPKFAGSHGIERSLYCMILEELSEIFANNFGLSSDEKSGNKNHIENRRGGLPTLQKLFLLDCEFIF